ncbi:MAG TPA: CAP domain-containing protein [Verrucomicrobiae bacterium]|nr:CAP domain-containing protein [Verrucomicrobiae bacterium]
MGMLARLVLICWLTLASAFAASTNFFELDPARFQSLAAQEIRSDTINHELLGAAILRETNERRAKKGFPPLKQEPKATEAAKVQSEIMRARGSISHENPDNARYRTLDLRVKSVGLNYRLIAENVATAFGLQYQSGTRFYPMRENGRTVFRYKPGGPPIPPHTYATFSKALIDAWMNSKGHRENILRKEAQYLGAYCAPANNKDGEMPMFYCTQVFFTPLK